MIPFHCETRCEEHLRMNKDKAFTYQGDSDHLRFALQEAIGTIVSSVSNKNTTLAEAEITGRDASKYL